MNDTREQQQDPRQFGKLAKALAAAQGAFRNPARNKTVKVRTRTGAAYEFSYATLDTILEMARPVLAANGLAVWQGVGAHGEGAGVVVTVRTRLAHESGEWLEDAISAKTSPEIQAIGSTITYLRRYAYCANLGIAAEDDDDGSAGSAGMGSECAILDNNPEPPRRSPGGPMPEEDPVPELPLKPRSVLTPLGEERAIAELKAMAVPFGKHKGKTFGELEKSALWWFCVKSNIGQPWIGDDGEEHPPKDSDIALRKLLDIASAHYKFSDAGKP
jgi:hypothetical protein